MSLILCEQNAGRRDQSEQFAEDLRMYVHLLDNHDIDGK